MMVFAIHYTMQEGEIFGVAQKIPLGKLADPLRDCPVCMMPWYGTVIYLIFGYHPNWVEGIEIILASMGINAVLNKIMSGPDQIVEAIDQMTDSLKPMKYFVDKKIMDDVIKSAEELNQKLKSDVGGL